MTPLSDPPANPWLAIPADDYERHMGDPAVGQLQYLSEILRRTIAEVRPATAIIPGCGTGNGFEHFNPSVTSGIIAVDINPRYLGILFRRFGRQLPGLTLVCADLETWDWPAGFANLVHCALIAEYLSPTTLVTGAARSLKPGGTLSVLLQLPGRTPRNVSPSAVKSLQILESAITLVDPDELTLLARQEGLRVQRTKREILPSGKSFVLATYQLAS